MTPKEKAKELIDKFAEANGNSFFAKECALIAVNTLIESRKSDSKFDDTLRQEESCYYTPLPMYLSYWKIVKREIQNVAFN